MQNRCSYLLSRSSYSVEWLAKSTRFLILPLNELALSACCGSVTNHYRNGSKLLRSHRHHGSPSLYHGADDIDCPNDRPHAYYGGMVQHKSGFNIIKATLVHITLATLTVLIVSQFLGDTSQSIVLPADLTVHTPFIEVLKSWAIDILGLSGKIFVIIMLVMMLLESLQSLGWIKYLHRTFKPFMKVLGLSDRAIVMWVAGAGFGLLYGSAIIIEEAKKVALTKEELEHLHISIGVSYSIVEETALFLALGLNIFWLLIPRFVTAAIAVHTCRAIQYLKRS